MATTKIWCGSISLLQTPSLDLNVTVTPSAWYRIVMSLKVKFFAFQYPNCKTCDCDPSGTTEQICDQVCILVEPMLSIKQMFRV